MASGKAPIRRTNNILDFVPPKILRGCIFALFAYLSLQIFLVNIETVEKRVRILETWKVTQGVVLEGWTRKLTDKYGHTVTVYPSTIRFFVNDGQKLVEQEIFTRTPKSAGEPIEITYDPLKTSIGRDDVMSTEKAPEAKWVASKSPLWVSIVLASISAWCFISYFNQLKKP